MLAHDTSKAWEQFLDFVKKRCSLAAFGNWLAPIRVVESSDGEITLEVPNVIVQDYLLSNYKEDLRAFLPLDGAGEPAIKFIVAPVKKKAPLVVSSPAEPAIDSLPSGFPELKLNENYRFETFIEGASNQFVKSAAMGVAKRPGQSYNPLFIHGDVGMGKTHILHSIGHYIKTNHKKLRIQCITTEAFINDLVENLRKKSINEMKRFYRSEVDVLLVDDIQFLQNRLNFEEELAFTFEALKNKGAQIVITSDKPPSLLKLSERTIGKMEGGLVTHMGVPDIETRVAILQHKAEMKGLHIPHKIAFFIAEHIYNNVRQLEGAINRLSAHCRLMNLNITEELVSKTLREMFQTAKGEKISIDQILKSVANAFHVKVSDIRGSNRTKDIALSRQVAMYLAKEMINESLILLGASFGKKHSTILHACKNIKEKMKTDEELRQKVGLARQNIQA